MAITLTDSFEHCYRHHTKYPLSLTSKSKYGFTCLKAYRERYQARHGTHFVNSRHAVNLPVRDVYDTGDVKQRNILSEENMKDWLGDERRPDPQDPLQSIGDVATKPDPACRFAFLVNASHISPFDITSDFLSRILTYHQVMPAFLGFLDMYTPHDAEDRELRFSSFRSEVSLGDPEPETIMPSLNRSGQRYQVCFNLKTVALKASDPRGAMTKTWKIRQAAVYHQFDVVMGTQQWILTDPHGELRDMIAFSYGEHVKHDSSFSDPDASFKSSLKIHLLFCKWAEDAWRAHVQSHEEIVHNLTSHLIGPFAKDVKHNSDALARFQEFEEIIADTIGALESNAQNMTALLNFYKDLAENEDFPSSTMPQSKRSIRNLVSQLKELSHDLLMHAARAKVQVQVIANRKAVLIQYLQAAVADRQEEYTATMWIQAERSSQDAIAMRIITVVTLIYLPPTFVSTFFSTDVVKYQGGGGGGGAGNGNDLVQTFSLLALKRWLQVTLPLGFLTMLVVGVWFFYERFKLRTKHEHIRGQIRDVAVRFEKQASFAVGHVQSKDATFAEFLRSISTALGKKMPNPATTQQLP